MRGGIDKDNIMNEYLSDPNKKIPGTHLNNICKIQQGSKTCRYICLVTDGFICSKNSPMKLILDDKVKKGELRSCGDNCDGIG